MAFKYAIIFNQIKIYKQKSANVLFILYLYYIATICGVLGTVATAKHYCFSYNLEV